MSRLSLLVLLVFCVGSVDASISFQVKDFNDGTGGVIEGFYIGVDLAHSRRNAKANDYRQDELSMREALGCEGTGWFAFVESRNYDGSFKQAYGCGWSSREKLLEALISLCQELGGTYCGDGDYRRGQCMSACDTGDNHNLAQAHIVGAFPGEYGSGECYPAGVEPACPVSKPGLNARASNSPRNVNRDSIAGAGQPANPAPRRRVDSSTLTSIQENKQAMRSYLIGKNPGTGGQVANVLINERDECTIGIEVNAFGSMSRFEFDFRRETIIDPRSASGGMSLITLTGTGVFVEINDELLNSVFQLYVAEGDAATQAFLEAFENIGKLCK